MLQLVSGRFLAAIMICVVSVVACSPAEKHEIRDGKRVVQIALVKSLQFSGEVIGATWSRDGRLLATAAAGEKHIKIWDTGSWEIRTQIPFGLGGGRFPMQFSRDGNFLITRSDGSLGSKAAFVFDVKAGRRVIALTGWDENAEDVRRNTPSSLIVNQPGDRLIVAFSFPHENPQICSYDTGNWIRVSCWPSNGAAFTLAAGVGDNLISSKQNGQVQIWSIETATVFRSFRASTTDIRSIAVDPGGRFIATGQGSKGANWDEQAQKLVTVGDDEGLRLWSYRNGQELARAQSLSDISAVSIEPSGRFLATVSRKSHETVSLYRVSDLAELGFVGELQEPVSDIRFSGSDLLLVAAGSEARIYAIQGMEK